MARIETGVPGLDDVLAGGIPRGFLVLLGGAPGAGKTILASQIAFHHARQGKRVLMLSALAEASTKLIAHLSPFSYFSPEIVGNEFQILDIQRLLTSQGLEGTLAEIRSAVLERHVELLIIDSLWGFYTLTADEVGVQRFLHSLGLAMYVLGCTTLLVDDRHTPGAEPSPEQMLCDAVLFLEVSLSGRRELRRLRALKVRGADPLSGVHTFEITSDGGRVYPRIESLASESRAPITDERLSWGVLALDELTRGGIPAYNSTLVLGAPGMGKTTLGLQFVAAGVSRGERCLYLTFQEMEDRLLHKASGFGMDLYPATDSGDLRILRVPVPQADVDKVLHTLLADIESRGVSRLVIDTINPLERDAVREGRFMDVVAALTTALRTRRVTTLLLREMTQLVSAELDIASGGESFWTPVDNILLMRPVELEGSLSTIISVLKMRDTVHDNRIYACAIRERGVEVGDLLEGIQGLLTGLPRTRGSTET